MPKVLTITAMVVAALLFLIFSIDLAVKFPFNRESITMDVGFIICALALGFAAWSTYRELT
jgi:hypothetical protein